MQVTSIRFERSLIDRLKTLAGQQSYQALIREILWDYVQQQSTGLRRSQFRAIMTAIAQQEQVCALTGTTIQAGDKMGLGLLGNGQLVPVCWDVIPDQAGN